jgi:2-dehydro-3-deoxygluconokinase
MSLTEKRFDLLTLGEVMWRLAAPGNARLENTRSLDVEIGGAEGNIAVNLARLGKRTAFWSRLPDNPLGRAVANAIGVHGVDVSGVCWGGSRVGLYFIEWGSTPRPTQVYYDRAHSAASEMTPADFDWSRLGETQRLHLTGITPALSASCRDTVRAAIAEATRLGVPVSFDLNYRHKLWSPAEAAPVLHELAASCDLVFGAERDALLLFGTSSPEALSERWHGATVVLTRGDEGAVAWDGRERFTTTAYPCQMVDRMGAGDAFDTGVLAGLMDGLPLGEALRWGAAVAALKLTIPGDFALISRAEVEQLLAAGGAALLR